MGFVLLASKAVLASYLQTIDILRTHQSVFSCMCIYIDTKSIVNEDASQTGQEGKNGRKQLGIYCRNV